MSTNAFNRAIAREGVIWNSFSHTYSFDSVQIADRIVIYGLYASSYLNPHAYLLDIETTDLQNLLDNYNIKIADLTAQETIIVADIVTKRYIAGVDKYIHDQKLVTKQQEIDYDKALWDARIAALASDTAALTTMMEKVASETVKTSSRISELQAYIMIEGYKLSEVEIEILEKTLQETKVDLAILNSANDILKIQFDTVNAATQLIDMDLQIAKADINIAEINRDIGKIDLMITELDIEELRTVNMQNEVPVALLRYLLALAKGSEVDAEKTYYGTTKITQAYTSYTNKLAKLTSEQLTRENALTRSQEEKLLQINNRIALEGLDVILANLDAANQSAIDVKRIAEISSHISHELTKINAAILVAETLAAANIETILTHTIQAAP